MVLDMADRFAKIWTIPYNLACYCAQLGRLHECQMWFKKAMAVAEHAVKRAAIEDPDLKPLNPLPNAPIAGSKSQSTARRQAKPNKP